MSSPDAQAKRDLEAADWLLRLQEEAPTSLEINEWVEWCNADPANRLAFERLMPVWQALESSRARQSLLAVPPMEAPISVDAPAASAPLPNLRDFPAKRSRPAPAFGRTFRLVASIGAVALLAAITYRIWWPAGERLDSGAQLATGRGQVRNLLLPDGSQVQLGAESGLAVQFTDPRRDVEVNQGEAYFSVHHDTSRPFVVHAGPLQVVAVGTAFDVLRTGRRVTVTVSEGTVEISRGAQENDGSGNPQSAAAQRLSRGGQLSIDEDNPQQIAIRAVSPDSADSWRRGRLEFVDQPLSFVIADINRYAAMPISINDAHIGVLHYTGTIDLRAINEWLNALPAVFPVEVDATRESVTIRPSISQRS